MKEYNMLVSLDEVLNSNPYTTEFIQMIPYHGVDINGNEVEKLAGYSIDINTEDHKKTIEKLKEMTEFIKVNKLNELETITYVSYKLLDVQYENKRINEELRNNIFGVLGNGKGNCCGFGNTGNFLFSTMGMESYVVYAKERALGSEKEHFYNIVKTKGKYVAIDLSYNRILSDATGRKSFNCLAKGLEDVQNYHHLDYEIKQIYDINGEPPRDENIISKCSSIDEEDLKVALINVLHLEGKNAFEIQAYLEQVDFGSKKYYEQMEEDDSWKKINFTEGEELPSESMYTLV